MTDTSPLARPGGTCPVCGVAIDRRAKTCIAHRPSMTPEHQRAAAEARWDGTPGGVEMTVIQAAPIAPYEAPGWLIEITGPWLRGRRAVGATEPIKILDRTVIGWGPANAIIEVTNRDGWRRHLLAELKDDGLTPPKTVT